MYFLKTIMLFAYSAIFILCLMMAFPHNDKWEEEVAEKELQEEVTALMNKFFSLEHDGSTYDERIVIATKLIELDPDGYIHYYNRGVVHAYKDEDDKAFDDYTRSLELNPKHVTSRANRAVIYADRKEFDIAISECEKCLQLDPNSFTSINMKTFIHKKEASVNGDK